METKRKLRLFCIGLISFVSLFYYREPGLNVFIFCTIVWLLTIYSQGGFKQHKSSPGFWVLSLAVAIAAASYTYYGDFGSMLSLFLSFYILGFYLTDQKFHIIIYPLLFAYCFATFIVRIFFIERWIPKRSSTIYEHPNSATSEISQNLSNPISSESNQKKPAERAWIRVWLIPIIISVLFILVYMASSSMFADVLTRTFPNLDFPVIFALTLLGFFLLFNFMYLLPIKWVYDLNEKVTDWDQGIQHFKFSNDQKNLAIHEKGAVITLCLLITLLTLFIIIYGFELYHGIHQQRLSAALHEQVNSIILSVVMAVAVILYYIRPTINNTTRAKKHPLLYKLAYCWILLNSLLVISAALHNAAYIQRLGLTQLRVGVYIFLLLCLIGLCLTYRKIKLQRSSGYLISVMFKIFFGTIILNSTINWSAVITRYNLTQMAKPDLNYLKTLDFNKYELYQYLNKDSNQHEFQKRIKTRLKFDQNKSVLSVAWYNNYTLWRINTAK